MHSAAELTPPATRQVGAYREFAPPVDLAPFVDAAWVYARPASAGSARLPCHRILPELGVSLSFACIRDASGKVLDASLSFQGPIRAIQLFTPGPQVNIEAVRLAPEWSRVLLRADPAEHADRLDPYEFVNRRRGRGLGERLMRTRSSREALQELLREVRELRDSAPRSRANALSHRAATMIRAQSGSLSLRNVARATGISERHLRRVLHEATGIGAKQFHRIHRLNRAVADADRGERPAWARVATSAGYFDQSHMIREFVAITGESPATLHRERQAENLAP